MPSHRLRLALGFRLACVCFAAATVFFPTAAAAAPFELNVDFGVADVLGAPDSTPNDLEFGYEAFDAVHTGGTNEFDSASVDSHSKVIAGVTITVSKLHGQGSLTFVDYAGEIGNDLLEEVVRTHETGLLVTLSNLPAGQYATSMYHHASGAFEQTPNFRIYVNNGSGDEHVATAANTFGFEDVYSPRTYFEFWATGGDVTFSLDGTPLFDPSQESWPTYLNGFAMVKIADVPEPASWALLALGSAALVVVRRCRR